MDSPPKHLYPGVSAEGFPIMLREERPVCLAFSHRLAAFGGNNAAYENVVYT
jgi:hypothetical protein